MNTTTHITYITALHFAVCLKDATYPDAELAPYPVYSPLYSRILIRSLNEGDLDANAKRET